MAPIACDIYGGNLSMDTSDDFALCDSYGLKSDNSIVIADKKSNRCSQGTRTCFG